MPRHQRSHISTFLITRHRIVSTLYVNRGHRAHNLHLLRRIKLLKRTPASCLQSFAQLFMLRQSQHKHIARSDHFTVRAFLFQLIQNFQRVVPLRPTRAAAPPPRISPRTRSGRRRSTSC